MMKTTEEGKRKVERAEKRKADQTRGCVDRVDGDMQAASGTTHEGRRDQMNEDCDVGESSARVLSSCIAGVDVVEVYSVERVSAACKQHGLTGGTCFDLKSGKSFSFVMSLYLW